MSVNRKTCDVAGFLPLLHHRPLMDQFLTNWDRLFLARSGNR